MQTGRIVRGFCINHYVCWRRTGDPIPRKRFRVLGSLEARFWTRVDRSNPEGCWPWTGPRDRDGYGKLSFQKRYLKAHRVALELAGVAIPDGMLALHHCDNPPCVRASHIYVGNHRDNARDAFSRGRRPSGRSAGGAR